MKEMGAALLIYAKSLLRKGQAETSLEYFLKCVEIAIRKDTLIKTIVSDLTENKAADQIENFIRMAT